MKQDSISSIQMQTPLLSFQQLGDYILSKPGDLKALVAEAGIRNQWFTEENVWLALNDIAHSFLRQDLLQVWLSNYHFDHIQTKRVGIIAAGNIPLVSFHDVLCVLASGHQAVIKLSDKDKVLMPHLLNKLAEFDSRWNDRFSFEDRFQRINAIIATGGNNTGRYFEYYFGKYPHIIRKNRHAAAVIKGNESADELRLLGKDVFQYFGLGCRNVSLLWLPVGYDFQIFNEAWKDYSSIMHHHGYRNNLDYQRTIYLINSIPLADIDFVNMVESKEISSPIASLHIAYYQSIEEVNVWIDKHQEQIQCMVNHPFKDKLIPYGEAQTPSLSDYADGIDTIQFLIDL
jgi:hypothetical protein